jgi:microcin C transport system substrate-binding protein
MKKILSLVVLLCLVIIGPELSYAQNAVHAIAMHGQPRYPANYKHFDYVNPDAPKGGTLRRAEVGTFDNLNPFLITGRVTPGLQEALLLTYDSLMVRAWNEPFTMYGLVAKSVLVPKERNWIEFNLDRAAKFHDGHAITAVDVEFSYKTLMQYGRPNQRRIYKLIKQVQIKNDHTIRFVLGQGYDRETVMILAGMPVLPQHYWQGKDFGKTTLKAPLSSGPYQIKMVDVGRRAVFERVKNYWAKDKPTARGLYNFDKLQYDFFRDDNIALQALSAGQIDLRREWSAVTWKRDYTFKAVDNGSILKEDFKNGRPVRAKFFVFNMRRDPFADKKVREALAYAFDFEWLNKNIFLGTQQRISSLFMNSELADASDDKFVPPTTSGKDGLRGNLRHAIELLKQAGYELHHNVMLSTATQKPLTFEILLNDPPDEKVALEYARTLKRLGIRASIRTVDTAQYIGRLSQFDFDMTINFWRNSLSPGTEQAVYWGSAAAAQEGSFNYSGLASAEIDGLITRLTSAQTRPDLVKAAQQLDHAVMKEWIGIPLYDASDDHVAHVKAINHPQTTPLYGPVIESWWYEPTKSGKQVSNDSLPE